MLSLLARAINYLFGNLLRRKHILIGSSLNYLQRERAIDRNYFDQVRIATLELVSHEIEKRKLAGSLAELGVFEGKFARYLNGYFPQRKLYLLDTFQGFDPKDLQRETEENLAPAGQDFSRTSVASVLSRMPFPDHCIPVKGFFPDSAMNIHDQFVLVSLDADLYEPIYQGLKYFYPRLVQGGYIFIHDVNNDDYKGSRKALEQFCNEENLGFVPIPDACGTAIICK